jgi:hypothetical protein
MKRRSGSRDQCLRVSSSGEAERIAYKDASRAALAQLGDVDMKHLTGLRRQREILDDP